MDEKTRDLLKARAIALAQEPEMKVGFSPILQLIAFSLGSETYGLESVYIREVYPLKDFTPLPRLPAYILGVINVRGQIIPVVDLKKLFHLPEQGITEMNKVIILNDEQMEFGILADEVHGTQGVPEDDIIQVPHTFNGIGEENLRGITRENLIVLNAKKLLTDKRMVVNDEIS